MAQTFKVTKERSHPAARKHRGKLVVSAISKTPITVTPSGNAVTVHPKNLKKDKNKNTKTTKTAPSASAPPAVSVPVPVLAPPTPTRPKGRPRKVLPSLQPASRLAKKEQKAAKLTRGRPHRIDARRLLDAEQQRGPLTAGPAGKVPLAASRIVEQLVSLLGRASVEAFRGKRGRPPVTLAKLEEQALQEALSLFQLKVSLQRGGEVRRVRVS